MSCPIFHVVPDKNTRNNHLLAIGSDGYKKIRYRGNGGGEPAWIFNLKRDLIQKANGTFTSQRRESGGIMSPAAAGLRRDVKDCVYLNLHFKSKTFEYNATTYEFKVNGKYVATLDPERGVIGSFSIQYINDKYSRYRLRDLGIRLTSKDGKTFWKFGVEAKYYEYLLGIHESLENIRHFFRPLFQTIKVEKKREEDDHPDRYAVVFTCELRDDIKYPVCPADQFTHIYGSIGTYGYISGIFHNFTDVPSAITESECKSYTSGSLNRFIKVLNDIPSISSDNRKYSLKLSLHEALRNIEVILPLVARRSTLHPELTFNTTEVKLIFDYQKGTVIFRDTEILVESTFKELGIDAFFNGRCINFIPKHIWELKLIKEHLVDGGVKYIGVKSAEGTLKLDLLDRFFRDDVVLEKLVGKELLIG